MSRFIPVLMAVAAAAWSAWTINVLSARIKKVQSSTDDAIMEQLTNEAIMRQATTVEVDMKTSLIFEGVPVFNYHMANAGGMDPSLLELAQQKTWIVSFEDSTTDAEIKSFCDNPPGNSVCDADGHPDEGGLSFAVFAGTEEELKQNLKEHPHIRPTFVEPDAPVIAIPEIPSEGVMTKQTGVTWGLDRIDDVTLRDLDRSYNPSTSSQGAGAHVYVADTGISTTHQDFEGRAVPTIDVTSGRVKECSSRDRNCASDQNGHGTHCAGTIGSKTYGVAKKTAIYAVKVLGQSGGSTSGILRSIDWVAAKGNKPAVWSASLGGTRPSREHAYETAFRTALTRGIVISVAAGNSRADACTYSPAFAPSAITVGSTDRRDSRSGFSNYGKCLDIYAPGTDITSTWTQGRVNTISGTSMACPHVSGVVALLLGDNPGMTPARAQSVLKANAHQGFVRDAKTGSPNLLLYTGAPTRPPTSRSCADSVAGSVDRKCATRWFFKSCKSSNIKCKCPRGTVIGGGQSICYSRNHLVGRKFDRNRLHGSGCRCI